MNTRSEHTRRVVVSDSSIVDGTGTSSHTTTRYDCAHRPIRRNAARLLSEDDMPPQPDLLS